MKIFYGILNFISSLGLYRIIGLVILYFLLSSNLKDLSYLNQFSQPKEYTYSELINTPKDDIPRYLVLKGAMPSGDGIISTTTYKRTTTSTLYYPVYSAEDSLDISKPAQIVSSTTDLSDDTLGIVSAIKDFAERNFIMMWIMN